MTKLFHSSLNSKQIISVSTKPATKTLIILSGLPFSGKSTIATALQKERGGVVLERDEIVERIVKDPLKQKLAQEIARTIQEPISKNKPDKEGNALNDAFTVLYVHEMVERIRATDADVIICDGTHLQKLSRAFLLEFPDFRKIAIAVKTPASICIERFQKAAPNGFRGTLTKENIAHLSEIAEWPQREEGFDEIQEI